MHFYTSNHFRLLRVETIFFQKTVQTFKSGSTQDKALGADMLRRMGKASISKLAGPHILCNYQKKREKGRLELNAITLPTINKSIPMNRCLPICDLATNRQLVLSHCPFYNSAMIRRNYQSIVPVVNPRGCESPSPLRMLRPHYLYSLY